MPINPITAYRLAAQAERANEALSAEKFAPASGIDIKVRMAVLRLNRFRLFNSDLTEANERLHADLSEARNERDEALDKIARMTSGLKRGASKV